MASFRMTLDCVAGLTGPVGSVQALSVYLVHLFLLLFIIVELAAYYGTDGAKVSSSLSKCGWLDAWASSGEE